MRLQLKMKEQQRLVKAKKRQHQMCMKELILNIIELEKLTGAKVEQDMLK